MSCKNASVKKIQSRCHHDYRPCCSVGKKERHKNAHYYLLDIQYVIHAGLTYSARTISWKKYTAGDTIPLMYLTDKPGDFRTDLGGSLKWFLPVSLIVIALVALVCYWLLSWEYIRVSLVITDRRMKK